MRLVHLLAVAGLFTGSVLAQQIYAVDDEGISPPIRVRLVIAYYPEAAKAARIEGNVVMLGVVQTDGTVGEIEVIQSLDTQYGLDREAVKALSQWEFEPATKDGKPVAVRMKFTTRFALD